MDTTEPARKKIKVEGKDAIPSTTKPQEEKTSGEENRPGKKLFSIFKKKTKVVGRDAAHTDSEPQVEVKVEGKEEPRTEPQEEKSRDEENQSSLPLDNAPKEAPEPSCESSEEEADDAFTLLDVILAAAGVKDVDKVNPCLKAGIMAGHIKLRGGKLDLDMVLCKDSCTVCGEGPIPCTVRDALYQPASGGGDYCDGNPNGAVECPFDEDCGGMYITGLCCGDFRFSCGKFHNHCTECKGYGKCIGDYRNEHCYRCDEHWFSGISGFPCPRCKEDGREQEECSLM